MKRLLTLGLVLVLSGCDAMQEGAQEATRSLGELTAREIGNLASRIFDDPSQAEELLESSGLSVERLDSLLYEIAADATRRAEYLEGLGSSGN